MEEDNEDMTGERAERDRGKGKGIAGIACFRIDVEAGGKYDGITGLNINSCVAWSTHNNSNEHMSRLAKNRAYGTGPERPPPGTLGLF